MKKLLRHLVLFSALVPLIGGMSSNHVSTIQHAPRRDLLDKEDVSSNHCIVTVSGLSLADAIADTTCDEIYIKNGTYPIENTIDIKRPVHIFGESRENSILQKVGGGSLLLVISTQNVTVEKLTLDAFTHDFADRNDPDDTKSFRCLWL